MNATFRPRVLAAALALAAAPALAHETPVITTTSEPVYYETLNRYYYAEPEAVTAEPATTTWYAVPAATVVEAEPPIVVYGERGNEDVLITNDVLASIASDPALSGRIDVETLNREVRLTGRVGTPGQVDRAGQHAWATDGVDDVHNLLRPRVGG